MSCIVYYAYTLVPWGNLEPLEVQFKRCSRRLTNVASDLHRQPSYFRDIARCASINAIEPVLSKFLFSACAAMPRCTAQGSSAEGGLSSKKNGFRYREVGQRPMEQSSTVVHSTYCCDGPDWTAQTGCNCRLRRTQTCETSPKPGRTIDRGRVTHQHAETGKYQLGCLFSPFPTRSGHV